MRFAALIGLIIALLASQAGAAVTCPTSLGKGQAFSHLQLMVGSPEGKFGTIAQNGSEFDESGKHGRDIFPLGDEKDVFLRCNYEGGQFVVKPLPRGTRLCEVAYTYINDYDTRADQISCR